MCVTVCVLDRFPYMSCEIICCEVPEILKAIATDGAGGGDGCPLRKLFSILDGEGDIDSHRAGYLEKASRRHSTRRDKAASEMLAAVLVSCSSCSSSCVAFMFGVSCVVSMPL